MAGNVATFADAVILASQQQDGHALAQLFSLDSLIARELTPHLQSLPAVRVIPALRKCSGYLKDPWEAAAGAHINALQSLLFGAQQGNLQTGFFRSKRQDLTIVDVAACAHHLQLAFEQQLQLVNSLLRWFGALTPGAWALPLLLQILYDLCDLAVRLDNAENAQKTLASLPSHGANGARLAQSTLARSPSTSQKRLEEAARQLNKAFTACVADRISADHESRRLGTYSVVNLIFKTYFRLKSTPLCKNILRALSAAGISPLETFSIADQVAFRFYSGVLAFLDEDYAKAEAHLDFAFNHCYHGAHKNQEILLQYLIPIRLLHGALPSATLMDQHPRLQALYGPFLRASREGDVRAYDKTLANSVVEKVLITKGVYIAMERAREGCLRTLVRRLWLAKERSTRIPLESLHRALHWVGVDASIEEAEWYVATLIHKGYVKGYISHERQMVVLSANNAFPSLQQVVSTQDV